MYNCRVITLTMTLFTMVIFSSCVSTVKPNNPVQGPYPESLENIYNTNKLLGTELCKLPEFQDGFSESEIDTLRRFWEFYNANQVSFDSAFSQMNNLGKPETRKYCSLLQAFFWIIQDNEIENYKILIEGFLIDELLDKAWRFDAYKPLSEDDTKFIIQETRNEKIKTEYSSTLKEHGIEKVQKHIFYDFSRKPSWFSYKTKKIINKSRATYLERWSDFSTVTDRLNSPEIVDYYVKRRVQYQNWNSIPGAVPDRPNIHYVFRRNKGDCEYISAFIVHCLKKSGYNDAYTWRVPTPHGKWPWHQVAVYYENGKKMVIDDGVPNPLKVGIVPYKVYDKNDN